MKIINFVEKTLKNSIKIKQNNVQSKLVPVVEIRILISPTEKYLRMLHYFLESLQQFGGKLGRTAKCVVSVSRDEPYRDLLKEYPWTSNYDVQFSWMDENLFKKYGYNGTASHRLKIKSNADVIILADADLLVAKDFDDVIIRSFSEQKVFGFIAHISPFIHFDNKNRSSKEVWKKIFDEAGLSYPQFENVHTGWGLMNSDENHRNCPFYFNYGFIVAPRVFVEKMGQSFVFELDSVNRIFETHFKSQIANTLCFQRYGIPCGTLSINYNFPLHVPYKEIRELNPDPKGENDVRDVKIFHYLGNGNFNKDDFQSEKSLERALQRKDLNDAETVFQEKLRLVHDKIMSN